MTRSAWNLASPRDVDWRTGQRITMPVTCLSDEFVARCDALYLRSRELNHVGV